MQCNNTLIFIYNIYYKILNVFYYITATTTKNNKCFSVNKKMLGKILKKRNFNKNKTLKTQTVLQKKKLTFKSFI